MSQSIDRGPRRQVEPSRRSSPRTVVADRDSLVLDVFSDALRVHGYVVVATTDQPEAAAALVRLHRPDLCVIDPGPDPDEAVQVLRELRTAWPRTDLVVLAAVLTPGVRALRQEGAVDALVSKTASLRSVTATLDAVLGAPRSRVASRPARPSARHAHDPERLTDRELDVLLALVAGSSNAQAATQLGISPHTVRSHVQSVLRKLGVSTRLKAAALAAAGLPPALLPVQRVRS